MYFIQYKEKELPLIVDFAVINRSCTKLGIKLQDFEQAISNPSQTQVVFFEALKRGAKLDNMQFDFQESDAEDILSYENNYGSFLVIFGECVLNIITKAEAKKK